MQQTITQFPHILDINACVSLILKYYTNCREQNPGKPCSFIRGYAMLLDPATNMRYENGIFMGAGEYSSRWALFR